MITNPSLPELHENAANCYQFSKCSAGCPVVEEMDVLSHQVIHSVAIGESELALDSKTIWICAGCYTCAVRCPNDINDMEQLKKWMKEVVNRALHEQTAILAGITPLKSVKMAEYMKNNVAGMSVPDDIIERMKNAEDPVSEGEKIALEQVERFRAMEGVRGAHFMAIGAEKTVRAFAEKANLLPRPKV